ncbi:MAG: hypothetical protein JXA22_10025, partial [Candidatus Thermoplasmatota archaeon]|nr:hypothetical protein [Candidatus Thermoplasmatota archaeon]
MDMSPIQKKKLLAVALVALLVIGAVLVIFLGGRENGQNEKAATIDDLLASTSQRTSMMPELVVASYSDRAYPMIATPIAAYYNSKELVSVPFLVAGENEGTQDDSVSTSVARFLDAYPEREAVVIGPLEADVKARLSYSGMQASRELSGDPTTVSIAAARSFWSRSDGAVLMTPCYEGYRTGLTAATLASYLDIPIIVCHGVDDEVASTLSFLEVKYTILCGPVDGYGKVLRVQDQDEILDALVLGMPSADGNMRSVMTDRLGIDPRYITLANPYDTNLPKVIDSFTEHFSGTVTGTDTGSTSDPSLSDTAEIHHIEIPEDYQYARVKISLVVDFVDSPVPLRTAEDDGQRGYLYFGVDSDEDGKIIRDEDSAEDHLEFMLPTLAYAYIREGTDAVSGLAYTEEPLFNSQGKHAVELLATLAYDPLGREQSTTYSIDLTVEKLDIPNHPLMPLASVCAPYLTVNRQGVLLARDEFSIYNDPEILSSRYFGDPSTDHTAYENGSMQLGGLPALSNNVAMGVKEKLNWLLADLSGQEGAEGAALAAYFGPLLDTDPYYVGIVGDTNNIPMFYYPNAGQGDLPQEGYYIAGDVFYSSMDVDTETPPNDIGGSLSAELAVGRLDGWDAQDISALICRTLFYDSIIGSFEGLREGTWADSAINNFGS